MNIAKMTWNFSKLTIILCCEPVIKSQKNARNKRLGMIWNGIVNPPKCGHDLDTCREEMLGCNVSVSNRYSTNVLALCMLCSKP